MRIVHVITRFVPGGADENTLLTCNQQARSGHEVTLVVGADHSPVICAKLDKTVQFVAFPTLRRELSLFQDFRALFAMARYFRKTRPDLVHTHTSKAGILGRLAAKIAGVRIIAHGVHILPFRNVPKAQGALYLLAERFCGVFTNLFVHVSGETRAECERRRIGAKALHIVAESGMNVDGFRRASDPDDAALLLASPVGSPQLPFVVLSLSALDSRKRLDRFLPVLRKVVNQRPNTVALLAGVGDERAVLEAQVAELGLSHHVRFLGFRSDPEKLLSVSDVLVLCSEREGLPRVVVQAGIAGVPAITTALPGIELIVRHGQTGFVVPLADISPMEACLIRLMDEPDLQVQLRRNLSQLDFSPWDERRMTTLIQEAYETITPLGQPVGFSGSIDPRSASAELPS